MANLTINDVVISTVTVNIQVMKIGSKQMTITVFRQLPIETIFDRDGELVSDPWGWVNYDEGKWFVFSDDGILYRCKINFENYIGLKSIEVTYPHSEYPWQLYSNSTGYSVPWSFTDKETAEEHRLLLLDSIMKLKDTPQLFIGA